MQTECRMAANPQTKPTDLARVSAVRLLWSTSTVAVYYYYSAGKLILFDGVRWRHSATWRSQFVERSVPWCCTRASTLLAPSYWTTRTNWPNGQWCWTDIWKYCYPTAPYSTFTWATGDWLTGWDPTVESCTNCPTVWLNSRVFWRILCSHKFQKENS